MVDVIEPLADSPARPRSIRMLALVVLVSLFTGAGWMAVEGLFGIPRLESNDEVVEIDGVSNAATTPKIPALRIDSPLGPLVVETYRTKLGPCYDLVFPDGRRDSGCLASSGIAPHEQVTGNPATGSILALNGSAWNAGLTAPGIGMLHHGLAHPSVSVVRIEPLDATKHKTAQLAPLRDSAGTNVYLVWTPPGLDRYVLAAYDAEGCRLAEHVYDVRAAADRPPGDVNDCAGSFI